MHLYPYTPFGVIAYGERGTCVAKGEGVLLSSIYVPLRLLTPKGYATHVPLQRYRCIGVNGYRCVPLSL